MKVAVVERKLFGGTCVNTGCTPTKTLVASAYAAHLARRAADYGVRIAGEIAIDMKAVKARKDAVMLRSRNGVEAWVRGMPNCTVYQGHARFVAQHEIAVGDERLTAERIFINAGGRALVPDMPGIDKVPILTNVSILDLDNLPRHLVIVGGSYIGLEFAQMYRRFGSEVTVVEKAPRLIQREDEDISATVKDILEGEGIAIRLGAECIRFEPRGGDIAVGVDCAVKVRRRSWGPQVLPSAIWTAPGTPMISGLEKAGIEVDGRGFIRVDDQLPHQCCGHLRARAIATARAPSPIRPITTSRSSPRISSTMSRVA